MSRFETQNLDPGSKKSTLIWVSNPDSSLDIKPQSGLGLKMEKKGGMGEEKGKEGEGEKKKRIYLW